MKSIYHNFFQITVISPLLNDEIIIYSLNLFYGKLYRCININFDPKKKLIEIEKKIMTKTFEFRNTSNRNFETKMRNRRFS